jgi:glycosyltransferase involved in cell wall biosynthesis
MSPLVSVVVPVFNGFPYLQQAVTSVIEQTHVNLQIVLVDGGSTDGSREWIQQQTDPRIEAILMPPGTTAAENWTAASAAAQGEFTKLLCQDDIIYPPAIAQQVKDLQENPHAVMAVAQRDIIDAKGKIRFRNRGCQGLSNAPTQGNDALTTCVLEGTNIFGEPLAVLFRTEHLKANLPWQDERPFLLDLEMYTRVMRNQQIVVAKQSIGAFRISESSWSTRLTAEQDEQLRWWMNMTATELNLTSEQRQHSARALRKQAFLRRTAYRILRLQGAFRNTPATTLHG